MRIFITGASGYIGKAVAQAFRRRGHHVTGLIRKKEKAAELIHDEIEPLIGDMSDTKSFAKKIEKTEVLVHCAFELSKQGVDLDKKIIDFFLNKAEQSANLRTIIYTSGVWVYGHTRGHIADEASTLDPIDLVKWRPGHEKKVLDAAKANVRTVVIRPGCVYGGQGSGSLANLWFEGVTTGKGAIIDSGNNHWAMIHHHDLAEAYVLAAEKELSGTILNVTDGSAFTVKQMVEAVAAVTGKAAKSCTLQEAEKQWGALVQGLTIDQKVSSQRAQRLLGWSPKHLSFIDDVALYYESWKQEYAAVK